MCAMVLFGGSGSRDKDECWSRVKYVVTGSWEVTQCPLATPPPQTPPPTFSEGGLSPAMVTSENEPSMSSAPEDVKMVCKHCWRPPATNAKALGKHQDGEGHINCTKDAEHFAEMTPMKDILFAGALQTEKYTRYMRIGYK